MVVILLDRCKSTLKAADIVFSNAPAPILVIEGYTVSGKVMDILLPPPRFAAASAIRAVPLAVKPLMAPLDTEISSSVSMRF